MFRQVEPDALRQACGEDPSWLCEQVLDWADSESAAQTADFLFAKPLKVVFVLAVAFLLNRLVRRAIRRFVDGIVGSADKGRLRTIRLHTPQSLLATGEVNLRSASRAETLAAVLKSLSTAAIYGIAVLTVLGEFGINLGPLIAGAGIVGVALGFGAQSLVKDFLSGIFMLVEDQYGVGDIVDLGEANGVVEVVTLRTTRVRDVNGTVWHVPNGQITRVGNKSQQWARALIDVSVAYGTEVRRAQDIIKEVADGLWHDPDWQREILEEPELWGVESLGVDGIDIRLVVKTKPSSQFKVARELRVRIKERLDIEDIEIPFPQRTLWVRNEDGDADGVLPKPAPARPAPRAATGASKIEPTPGS